MSGTRTNEILTFCVVTENGRHFFKSLNKDENIAQMWLYEANNTFEN